MHFTRKLISAGLVFVLLIGLVCYGYLYNNLESGKSKVETALDSTETVRLWYTDDTLTDYFTNAAVAFHESNPGIRVIPILVGSSEYLDTIYKNSIGGSDFPDVYVASNDSLAKAYLSGIASEIQNPQALSSGHFSQVAVDAVTYENQQIAYPLFFETSVLAYNKTYLEKWAEAVNAGEVETDEAAISEEDLAEAVSSMDEEVVTDEEVVEEENGEPVTYLDYVPDNIDELLVFADAYNAPDGVEGVFKWDVTDVFYNYFFVGKYLTVGGPAGDDAQNVDIYNANAIQCLDVYQALNQFFSIDAKTSNYKSTLEDFTSGKSVFTVVTSDAIKTIHESQAEALDKFNEVDAMARNEAAHRTQMEEAAAIGGAKSDSDSSSSDSASSSSSSSSSASDDSSSSTSSSDDEAVEEPTELQKEAEALKAKVFDFEFARIPMVSKELEAKSLSVTNALAVNGFSEHMAAANKFAEFATTTYCGSLYQKSGKIAASYDAKYEEPELKVFQDEYANSIPLPKMMEASNFWVQLEVLFTRVWAGEDIQPLVVDLSKQIENQTIEEE